MDMQVENGVTVAEVAKRLKVPAGQVEAEARALGCFVGANWAGQMAMSERDAAGLVSGKARRDAEHATAWRAHQDATEAWQRQREEVRRAAFDAGWKVALRAGQGNPRATDAGHAAAREAVANWERANPEPAFDEPESRVKSWIRKATAGAR
jgi:hypothetical protein